MELTKTHDYAIYGDVLIFKSEFNKPIDKYANLIKNYTQIIFSNYEDLKLLFETNNNHNYKYNSKFKQNQFNQPIQLNELLNKLTHLTFGFKFNQPIQLNHNLTHLIFGNQFNKLIQLN